MKQLLALILLASALVGQTTLQMGAQNTGTTTITSIRLDLDVTDPDGIRLTAVGMDFLGSSSPKTVLIDYAYKVAPENAGGVRLNWAPAFVRRLSFKTTPPDKDPSTLSCCVQQTTKPPASTCRRASTS